MLLEGGHIIEVKGGDTKSHSFNQDELVKEIKKINTSLEYWPSIRIQVNDKGGLDNTNIAQAKAGTYHGQTESPCGDDQNGKPFLSAAKD